MIETRPNLGYRPISDFAAETMRKLFLEHAHLIPCFVHINTYYNHANIRDNKIGCEANFYFRIDCITYCDECDKTSCKNIDFALSLPKIAEPLKRSGDLQIQKGRGYLFDS